METPVLDYQTLRAELVGVAGEDHVNRLEQMLAEEPTTSDPEQRLLLWFQSELELEKDLLGHRSDTSESFEEREEQRLIDDGMGW